MDILVMFSPQFGGFCQSLSSHGSGLNYNMMANLYYKQTSIILLLSCIGMFCAYLTNLIKRPIQKGNISHKGMRDTPYVKVTEQRMNVRVQLI